MAIYLVTYDLRAERDAEGYQEIWDALEALGGHRALESVWLVNSALSARQLREHVQSILDDNDRLWVSSVRRLEYSYTGPKKGTNDWLAANPPS